MADNPNSPVFADRYRFEPVSDDWDRGRSGYTHLVFDLKKNRLGVIKRTETTSKQASSGLKNEAEALRALKGLGVPDVYDIGQAEYISKSYVYLVIEYIDGIRVEGEISSLTISERVKILTQLFGLLAQAHQRGIVNGDVDLKHLFWRKENNQLIVIDWGNAKLNVDKAKKTEFAYDLARSAEIIYSLTVGKLPPVTGSVALPEDPILVSGLAPLPLEFRNICQWAPRTPTAGAKPPNTAEELFEIATRWKDAIVSKKPYRPRQQWSSRPVFWFLTFIGLLILITAALFIIPNLMFPSKTPILLATQPNTPSPIAINLTNTANPIPSETPITPTVELSLSPTQDIIPNLGITPPPKTYFPVLTFDDQSDQNECWENTLNESSDLKPLEAFTRRNDRFWSFSVEKNREIEDRIQTDFSQCFSDHQIRAISMNVWVSQIEQKREFGFFLEDENGNRRDYTIWLERVNEVDKMYLRLKEGDIKTDYELLITSNMKSVDAFPRLHYQFAFLAFFEINNDGLDILYLKEGPFQKAVLSSDIDPSLLIRADNAVRPTLGNIQTIGLIGYGGEIETAIWPLVFLESK